jgi:hypothetical protein
MCVGAGSRWADTRQQLWAAREGGCETACKQWHWRVAGGLRVETQEAPSADRGSVSQLPPGPALVGWSVRSAPLSHACTCWVGRAGRAARCESAARCWQLTPTAAQAGEAGEAGEPSKKRHSPAAPPATGYTQQL